mgnify:CR=1 FL=1
MDILFIHGFNSTPQDLRETIQLLQQHGHRVIAPSMKSFALDDGQDKLAYHSTQEWLDEVKQAFISFCDETTGDVGLAGHSLGGAICTHLLTSETLVSIKNRVTRCAFLATPAGVDDHFLNFWRTTSSEQIFWPFSLQVQMFSFLRQCDRLFNELKTPSIVLQGEQDLHIPPSSGSALAEQLQDCRGCWTHPDADHFFPNSRSAGARYLQAKLVKFFTNRE